MRINVILMVYYFIQIKEAKMSLPTKDGKFSPYGLFIDIYGR
jgi:hypothetical protein